MAAVDTHPADAAAWSDPIVDEVRTARAVIAAECYYDLERIIAALQERSRAAGRATVTLTKFAADTAVPAQR